MSKAEKVRHLPISKEKPRLRWLEGFRRRQAADPFEEMERMFDHMMTNYFPTGWLHPMKMDWTGRAGAAIGAPKVDLIDKDSEILLRAEVPGVTKDNLEVTMTDDSVTIRGTSQHEEKEEEGDYYYSETSRGEFSRSVTLPAHVDGSKATATYKDGILELTLPKLETSRRHKLEIAGE
ncbi:MAG: Hsp20/alpha crystallin family protein [Thiogranum sp.]|nr:Hsp20/alpha crystallin family protein [Thiogranum sp.]